MNLKSASSVVLFIVALSLHTTCVWQFLQDLMGAWLLGDVAGNSSGQSSGIYKFVSDITACSWESFGERERMTFRLWKVGWSSLFANAKNDLVAT